MVYQMATNGIHRIEENSIDKNSIDNILPPETQKRFTPPTLEQVAEYCKDRKNNIDPEQFIDHYTTNGWMVGKNKMKDWKASVRTWERNSYSNKTNQKSNNKLKHKQYEQSDTDYSQYYDN